MIRTRCDQNKNSNGCCPQNGAFSCMSHAEQDAMVHCTCRCNIIHSPATRTHTRHSSYWLTNVPTQLQLCRPFNYG